MTRPPLDATPQRQLVDELRVLLDRPIRVTDTRLALLILANPRSIRAPYVLRNIGKRRMARLMPLIDATDKLRHDAIEARARAGLSPDSSRS